MKKITVLILLLVIISMVIAAEEKGVWDWKENVASTTYGVVLLPVNISSYDAGFEEDIFVPGIDIRVFNGKNVGKRGGFYTGVETGAVIFLPVENELTAEFSGTSYPVYPEAFIATVFVMAKYGYRLDLGVKLFGVSLGWEMGIGARIASGSFDLGTEINGYEGSTGMGYDSSAMAMILDTAVEASVRIGPNFRFVAKLGGMLTPPLIQLDAAGGSMVDPATADETGANSIMKTYEASSAPVILAARVGFIVSY